MLQELNPLREQAHTMQAELDARNEHVTRLEEENRRWQECNDQLLTRYGLFVRLFIVLSFKDADIAF